MTRAGPGERKEALYVYVLKHVENEGPGTLGTFLEAKGVTIATIDLFRGEPLPPDVRDACAIISMGGPMNVYEEERYPFLRDEDRFLKAAVAAGVPVLGICLGAQLLAKAHGGRVTASAAPETGFFQVGLTRDGLKDPLFSGVDDYLHVFQWHKDTFAVPPGGARLAEGDACLNQAFRLGKNAYGLQFHVEVTLQMIDAWFSDRPEKDRMLKTFVHVGDLLHTAASIIYTNFMNLMLGVSLADRGADAADRAASGAQ